MKESNLKTKTKKRPTREEKTIEMINLFMNAFSEYGLDGTTTKKLAKAADMTESLIYMYFENKDDIIFQCAAYHYERIQNELISIFKKNIKKLDGFPKKALSYLDKNIMTARFLLQVLSHPFYSKIKKEDDIFKIEEQNKTARDLAKEYNIEYEVAASMIYLLHSVICDYTVRETREQYEKQMKFIVSTIKSLAK